MRRRDIESRQDKSSDVSSTPPTSHNSSATRASLLWQARGHSREAWQRRGYPGTRQGPQNGNLGVAFCKSSLSRTSDGVYTSFATALKPDQNTANMTTQQGAISKRRKFVADGVFYAELNELFQRELAEEGYSGVEVRVTPTVTDISTPALLQRARVELTLSSHSSNTHPRSPWRARSTNPRTHISDPEAIQVSRELCLSLRRQSPEPGSLSRRSVRISTIQTPQRSCSTKSMLWCIEIYYGEWCEGLRGGS